MRNVCVVLLVAMLCGCPAPSTDQKQSAETERMISEANQQIGMPDIINFQERRVAKQILELRDTEIVTYAYIADLNSGLHFLGEAIGYGLPYSVQFTNPQKFSRQHIDTFVMEGTLPQPDPNGLFMPEGLSATWIMLRDPETKKVRPVYVEPQLVVSPFKLKSVDSYRE